ncbi:FG-GAP-like repeat-containing protein [Roseateles chitinivorans]|uniref:FG-GAP-like repeat-containing protein n=1 Tax=Roseateles chitinivorans TaxID=2917965 RepID=UPI003D67CC72
MLPGGDAYYTVALQLPPGTGGVVPTLGLAYASRSEDGILGRGWTLSGLSQITHCGTTIAQDGVHRGVSLTAVDQFCMDGQRLILRAGTHGATAEYRTELDQFSQVSSTGTDPAIGPSSFVVRAKDGLVYTYGGTADARVEAQGKAVVHTWALSRVQDRRGNYYDVDYSENNATGESYPERIRYTGNLRTGMQTYNAVRFAYETRPDPWSGYVMGSVMQRNRRLKAVQTVKNTDGAGAGGALVREYRIAYAPSPSSGRSLIASISDCDGQGVCLPATSLTWTTRDPAANTSYAAGSGIWGGPSITIESSSKQPIPSEQVKAKTLAGDFNGDGATDLLYADGGSAWKVCLAAKTTFNCQTWPAAAGRSEEAIAGDFNGDGRTDIALLPTEFNVKGNYTVCLSTGTGFSCQTWSAQTAGRSAQRYMVADMDVDGRDDLLVLDFFGGYLCRSNGAGFDPCVAQANLGAALQMGDDPEIRSRIVQRIGDLNGDGRPDVLKFNMRTGTPASGHWQAYVTVDGGFAAWPIGVSAGIAIAPLQPGQSLVADYNGDPFGPYGDTAAVLGTSDPNTPVMEICKSTGTSLICSTRPYSTATQVPFDALVDADRDGKIDGFGGGLLCQLSETAVTPCVVLPGPPSRAASDWPR